MTLIKRLWILRGDVQIAIKEKNQQIFAQVIETLQSPGFDFAVINSKMATNYLDIVNDDYEKVLDRSNSIPKLVQNVKNLQAYRMERKLVNVDFGEEETPLHTLWVARAKFEKFKYETEKHKDQVKENHSVFEESLSRINNLLNFARKNLSFDEVQALMVIKEEANAYWQKHTNEWFKDLPPR